MQFRNRSELEAISRAAARSAYLGNSRAVCRTLGQFNLVVSTDDLSMAPHLMLDGFWEAWVTLAFCRLVQPHMRVIDAGCGFGYFSVLFSRLAGADNQPGQVHCYDADPVMTACTQDSLRVNGMERTCTVTNLALSDRPQTQATFHHVPGNKGAASLFQHPLATSTTQVAVSTLDQRHRGEKIDLIKLDCEGADYLILRGASELIRSNPGCWVIVEHCRALFHEAWGSSAAVSPAQAEKGMFDLAQGLGLVLHAITFDGEIASVSPTKIAQEPERVWYLAYQSRG